MMFLPRQISRFGFIFGTSAELAGMLAEIGRRHHGLPEWHGGTPGSLPFGNTVVRGAAVHYEKAPQSLASPPDPPCRRKP